MTDYRSTYPDVDHLDRFRALKEAQPFLKQKKIVCRQILEVLSKTDSGSLEFRIGGFVIFFTKGFGVWSERKDVIQVSIEVNKEEAGEIVVYEYGTNEIAHMEWVLENGK